MAKNEIDRLTQENAAALAAGMSYGKWKAKQYVAQAAAKSPAVAETPQYRHVCEYCGQEFFIKAKRQQKYCCEECRREASYQREREKNNVPCQHVCEYCGQEFVINTKRKQRFCCEECRQQAHRQQVREHHAMSRIRRRENKQLLQVAGLEGDK